MRLVWEKLALANNNAEAQKALHRSSNNLAVIGNKAYVYGGEAQPRQPVDNELWIVDLKNGNVEAGQAKTKPAARVGSAMVASGPRLYLWGGRESTEMTPCNSDLWMYDTTASEPTWECLPIDNNDDKDIVEERSFHAMAAAGERLYLHAGCPAVGRSAKLDSLPLGTSKSTWTHHPAAPGPGRGGTVLCPLQVDGKDVLVRYGGFAGYELGSLLDVFDVEADEWASVDMPNREGEDGHPLARSVHALVPVSPPKSIEDDESIVALMLFGERGPAPAHLGHAGAGQFHQDAFALVRRHDLVSNDNPLGFGFKELSQTSERDQLPTARGWFPAGWSEVDGGKVVVHGGLNDQNERLGDFWVGRIEA